MMRRSPRVCSRPSGAASSMWIAVARYSAPKALPSANSSGMSESPSPASSQAKPVAAVSMPRRLSGRRAQAKSPTPMKPQPMISPRVPSTAGMGT